MKYWLAYILLFFSVLIAAEVLASPSDSLQEGLRSMPAVLQVEMLTKEAARMLDRDHEKATQLSLQALSIAEKSGELSLIGVASYSCGMAYINQTEYNKAASYLSKALELQVATQVKPAILAATLKELGNLEKGRSNYTQALSYFFGALRTSRETKDSSAMAYLLNSIGGVYITLKQEEKGLDYLLQAVEIRKRTNDVRGLASTYNNLGIAYSDLEQNPKALEYYFKTLQYSKQMNFEKGIALTYNNIGHVYFSLKDYENALRYYELSLGECRRLKLQGGLSAVLVNLGDLYTALQEYDRALAAGKEAYSLAINMADKNRLSEACQTIANTYARLGKFAKAYELQTQYSKLRDSLYNEAEARETVNLDAQYQNDEKQKAIEVLQKEQEITELELRRKENLTYFYGIAGVMLILLVIILYSRNRVRMHANRDLARQNHEIREQSIEIMLQTDIIRTAHHKITDSIRYAQRIQNAVFPEQADIKRAFPDSFVFFRPLDLVSGDFYWFSKLDEDTYIWAAADCTGHGVPGALMTMMGNTLLHQIVNISRITAPDQILYALEKGIRDNLHRTNHSDSDSQSTDGMDIAVCSINTRTREMGFAGANRPIYLVRDKVLTEIKGSKYSVGGMNVLSAKVFEAVTIPYLPNDRFYMCSDGYSDQFGGKHERKFMAKNFKRLLVQIHHLSMPMQRQKLEEAFVDWKGMFTQTDDVMVIGFSIGEALQEHQK